MVKMKLRKGDKVTVIAGKYKGTTANIENVVNSANKVLVKGVNTVVRHLKMQQGQGGRVEVDKPSNASKVMLVCPKCEKTTRVGYKFSGKKKVRFCKKCKEII